MKYLLRMTMIVCILSVCVPASAGDAEVQSFLQKIQQAGMTADMNELFGLELPASGPLEPGPAFQRLSEVQGDIVYRGESQDRFLEVGKRAVEFLRLLRSRPEVLAAHNQWSLSHIRPSGPLREFEIKPLFDLVGDDKFSFSDYARLVPLVSYLWNQMRSRGMVEDFNLIFDEKVSPDARVPMPNVRGHLMDIVGGYWGDHIDVDDRFNFLAVLHEAAEYCRELQANPNKLIRYNRKFSSPPSVPGLPQTGGISNPRSREKLLSLAGEAVLKNSPLRRQLSSF